MNDPIVEFAKRCKHLNGTPLTASQRNLIIEAMRRYVSASGRTVPGHVHFEFREFRAKDSGGWTEVVGLGGSRLEAEEDVDRAVRLASKERYLRGVTS